MKLQSDEEKQLCASWVKDALNWTIAESTSGSVEQNAQEAAREAALYADALILEYRARNGSRDVS